MADLKIEGIRGLSDLEKKLSRVGNWLPDEIWSTTQKVVNYVHEQVPPYPSASGDPYPFKTEKQYWFVRLSILEGSMKVPYRRTGTTGRKITTDVRKIGSETVGTIGTDSIYAPWVISTESVGSRGPQATYHQGNWYTLQNVVQKAKKKVVDIYRQTIMKRLLHP